MTILEQALSKINSIHKKQYDFFLLLIQGLIGIAGKRTFRNLARYIEITEYTFARHMAKAFDFIGLKVSRKSLIDLLHQWSEKVYQTKPMHSSLVRNVISVS